MGKSGKLTEKNQGGPFVAVGKGGGSVVAGWV